MQRYLINIECVKEPYIYMNSADSYHIRKVMRMNVNDEVICVCEGLTYRCVILEIDECVKLQIIESYQENTEMPVYLSIAHGLVNREKMEETVEKLCLLGASEYVFFPMERSIVKTIGDKIDKKTERLQKIVKEATEVAHRTKLMNCLYLNSFKEFLKYSTDNFDYLLFAYENEDTENGSFKNIIKKLKKDNKILVLVGPEGGISSNEVKLLEDNGFIPCTLGPRILRTEVAPTYITSSISYELEIKE